MDPFTSKLRPQGAAPERRKSNTTGSPLQIRVSRLLIVAVIALAFGCTVTVSIAIHAGLRESEAVTSN